MPDKRLQKTLAYRIALCERMTQVLGDLELEMRAPPSHGQPGYQGPCRADMQHRHWVILVRIPGTDIVERLGSRKRPPTEPRIRRALERLEKGLHREAGDRRGRS